MQIMSGTSNLHKRVDCKCSKRQVKNDCAETRRRDSEVMVRSKRRTESLSYQENSEPHLPAELPVSTPLCFGTSKGEAQSANARRWRSTASVISRMKLTLIVLVGLRDKVLPNT